VYVLISSAKATSVTQNFRRPSTSDHPYMYPEGCSRDRQSRSVSPRTLLPPKSGPPKSGPPPGRTAWGTCPEEGRVELDAPVSRVLESWGHKRSGATTVDRSR